MMLQFPRLKTLLMTFLFVVGHGPPPVWMTDFQTVNASASTAVTEGTSVAALDKKNMKQYKFGVSAVMTVENWTRFTLKGQSVDVSGGVSFHGSTNPPDIKPCKKEVLAMQNGGSGSSYGIVSWLVSTDVSTNNRRFVLMWSASGDHNLYSNWMGLGLTGKGYTDTSEEKRYFHTMYYKTNTTNLTFNRKEFYGNLDPVTLSDDEFEMWGTMTKGYQAVIRVIFRPVKDNNLAPEILKKVQEARNTPTTNTTTNGRSQSDIPTKPR
uniref:Coluporin-29 n=1 Tax=Colubraria reticulata TaxID=604273 RepID=A0A499RQH3_9CAEN|nr:coluporin-29 [Colubraria reticulata]